MVTSVESVASSDWSPDQGQATEQKHIPIPTYLTNQQKQRRAASISIVG